MNRKVCSVYRFRFVLMFCNLRIYSKRVRIFSGGEIKDTALVSVTASHPNDMDRYGIIHLH